MLSNINIIKELERKNIAISPLKQENIKGASINLTASKIAWSKSTKKVIDTSNGIIKIPPHDTALILTNEIVAVSNKIGGTFHSRVKDVSYGKGHIGTTLNPCWMGYSLIAIHNHIDADLEIKVGSPFVTLIFYYLKTPASVEEDNPSGRSDIVMDLGLERCEEYIKLKENERSCKSFLKDYLKDKNSDDYKEYMKCKENIVNQNVIKNFWNNNKSIIFSLLIIWILFLLFWIASKFFSFFENNIDKFFIVILTSTITILVNRISHKE